MKFRLEDFPDEIYVHIEDDFRKRLFSETIERTKTHKELANILKAGSRTLYSWFVGERAIPLKKLRKISEIANVNLSSIESHIIRYQGHNGKGVKTPIFPLTLTHYLGRIIGHLFVGDGSIDNRDRVPSYSLADNEIGNILISQFKECIKNVFGNAEIREFKYSSGFKNTHMRRVVLPSVIGRILIHIFGRPSKKKDVLLPEVITSSKEVLSQTISAIFDDDGSVTFNRMTKGSRAIKLECDNINVLLQLQRWLSQFFGVNSHIYTSRRKNIYRLHICDKNSLNKFRNYIGFTHPEKQEKLGFILNIYKR